MVSRSERLISATLSVASASTGTAARVSSLTPSSAAWASGATTSVAQADDTEQGGEQEGEGTHGRASSATVLHRPRQRRLLRVAGLG